MANCKAGQSLRKLSVLALSCPPIPVFCTDYTALARLGPLTAMTAANLNEEFLAKFPQAADELGPENVQRLLSVCSEVALPAERRLLRDRMPADSVYIVLEGELVATVDNNGHTVEVGRIHPGDWLGEVAVLSGNRTASSNVITATPCRLLKLRAQDFENLALHDEEISHVLVGRMVELMADRLRSSNAAAQLAENI